jgi:hypothetical protein
MVYTIEEPKFSLTDTHRSLDDASFRLKHLNDEIRKAGGMTTADQRAEKAELITQINEAVSKYPQRIGNKGIIEH